MNDGIDQAHVDGREAIVKDVLASGRPACFEDLLTSRMGDAAAWLDDTRTCLLYGEASEQALDALAEQHWLKALALLEAAQRECEIAAIHQARARAAASR